MPYELQHRELNPVRSHLLFRATVFRTYGLSDGVCMCTGTWCSIGTEKAHKSMCITRLHTLLLLHSVRLCASTATEPNYDPQYDAEDYVEDEDDEDSPVVFDLDSDGDELNSDGSPRLVTAHIKGTTINLKQLERTQVATSLMMSHFAQ
jgi:hypothetical protein